MSEEKIISIESSSQEVQQCDVVYADQGGKDSGHIAMLFIPPIAEDVGTRQAKTVDAAFDEQNSYVRGNITVDSNPLDADDSVAQAFRASLKKKNVNGALIDFLVESGRGGALYNFLGIKIDQAFAGQYISLEGAAVQVDYAVQDDGSVLVTNTFSGEYVEASKQYDYSEYQAGLKAEKPNTTHLKATIVHRIEMKEDGPVVSIVQKDFKATGAGPQVSMMRILLADQMQIELNENFDKNKALETALEQNDSKIIIALLKQGARIDIRLCGKELKKTILHYAVEAGEVKLVKQLLKEEHAHISVNQRDNQGKTAFHYAAAANSEEMVLALADKGARATIQDNEKKIALHYSKSNSSVESYLYVLTGVEAYHAHSAAKKLKSDNTKNKITILEGLKGTLVGEKEATISGRLHDFDNKAVDTLSKLEDPENKGLWGWFSRVFREIKAFKREKFGGQAVQNIIVPSETQSSHGEAFASYILTGRKHLESRLPFFAHSPKEPSSDAGKETKAMILGG